MDLSEANFEYRIPEQQVKIYFHPKTETMIIL